MLKANIVQALLVASCLVAVRGQEAETKTCKVCLTNEAYCVNETAYQNCVGGEPIGNAVLCESGKVCTDSPNICELETDLETNENIKQGCTSGCGICLEDATHKTYTCMSNNTFARCPDPGLSSPISCPEDQYCSMDVYKMNGQICAPQCVLDFFEFSTTCSADQMGAGGGGSSVPQPTYENMIGMCEATPPTEEPIPKYYLVANDEDTECKSYIYCQEYNGNMTALFYTCTGYFDKDAKKCVSTKPETC